MHLAPARLPFSGILLAASLTCGASAGAQTDDEAARVFENASKSLRIAATEFPIGFDDPSMSSPAPLLSPDGRSIAYSVSGSGKMTVVHNGVESEPYDGLSEPSLQFSPDSSHFTFVAKRGDDMIVVLDGEEHAHPNISEHGVTFSSDGSRVAWVAATETQEIQAFVDGKPDEPFDSIGEVTFSPDNQHYAYVAKRSGLPTVVLDGVEGDYFDEIRQLTWSNVGGHLFCVARSGEVDLIVRDTEIVTECSRFGRAGFTFPKNADRYAIAVYQGDMWHMLVDGELHEGFKNVFPGASFSDDGRHLVYAAGRGRGHLLVLDGEVRRDYVFDFVSFGPKPDQMAYVVRNGDQFQVVVDGVEHDFLFDQILPPGVMFSDDGEHIAYAAKVGERKAVVYDGKRGPFFTQYATNLPRFNGERLFYSIKKRGSQILFVDGEPQEAYKRLIGPSYSGDLSRYAYFGQSDDGWELVVDGEVQAKYPFARDVPVFSHDGTKLAFVAGRERNMFVVLNGVEGKALDLVGPDTLTFSPDGQHVAYLGATADRRFVMVDDAEVDVGFSGFLGGDVPTWDDERSLRIRGGRLGVWVRLELDLLQP